MDDFVCFTMLGGRKILMNLHLENLTKYFSGKIIALAPSDKNIEKEINKKFPDIELVERDSKSFKLGNSDQTYDYLISKYGKKYKKFILVHDDTILTQSLHGLRIMLDTNTFVGAIDNASDIKKSPYRKLLLDNIPMSHLRIGTWFLCGDIQHVLSKQYTFGKQSTEYPLHINFKYKSFRLQLKRFRLKLNGGFDFNIRSRLAGDIVKIITPKCAHHFTRMTAGFQSRGMLKFVDTEDEQLIWFNRLNEMRLVNSDQFQKDVKFLNNISNYFAEYNLEDNLFNSKLNLFLNNMDR
jgi:hypothetical protein